MINEINKTTNEYLHEIEKKEKILQKGLFSLMKNRKKHKDINLNYSFKEIPLENYKKGIELIL